MVKIVLDAGHDINTPGKGVAGMKEFEFNRAVVKEIANRLTEYEGVEMKFSHDLYDGIDTPLKDRTKLANEWGADVFVSVHANAASSSQANGIETFIHPKAPERTVNLGAVVHGHLIRNTGITNRGLKREDFYVLDKTRMDAFLAECGFMTHPGDLEKLKSNEFRTKCAHAIMDGLAENYKLKKKAKPTPAPVVNSAALPSVYAVTVRDFDSEHATEEFINYARQQYPSMGYHKEKLR